MDHSYVSSSKLNTLERPIRTYRRSRKPPLVKEIKVECNIKLEPDVEIVDDYTSSEVLANDRDEADQISIHHTYPPEMLVINIKDVMTSTHFDSELLSAVKTPSISETVMKSGRTGTEGDASKLKQVEKLGLSEESIKLITLPAPPVQLKKTEIVLTNLIEAEAVLSKPECPEASLKPKSSEVALLIPKSPEAVLLKLKSPEKDLLKPNSPVKALLKPNSPEKVVLKPNSPEKVLLKPDSSEAVVQPKIPVKPDSPEAVVVDKKSSVSIPLKMKSSAGVQVKPKLPRRLLPKPGISEAVLLNLTSSEAAQPPLNTYTASPLISSVSEVVQSQTTSSKTFTPNISAPVPSKHYTSKSAEIKVNAHDLITSRPTEKLGASPIEAKEYTGNSIIERQNEPVEPFKKPTIAAAAVKHYVTKTAQPHRTEDQKAPLQASEATLVKLKRKGGAVLVMTGGKTPRWKTPSESSPDPPISEYEAERPDEILEPKVIKLNLPEYVVDYEPNSKAPALPPIALLPLIPLPLPSLIDEEHPMIVDSVKHLQEQLGPLLPRSWLLRVEKDGIFAMLFAPGLTCAVQRAVYASYDGNELRFIVHGRVVPKDHSVYEYRLMKPPLALTVESVRDFVNVVMGAIHSMIQHHVCIGINDEDCVRERRNHPGCRLDDNFYGEEGYTKTLRSLQCAYLVWRKNTKRCSECLFFKTLWRSRSRRRSTPSEEGWGVREPKNRKR